MGFFHGITPDMPNLNNYAEAKAFHDATKLNRHGVRWPSKTKIKHCFTCNGDESIAFQLYDTECVVYHPDGTITVRGYGTQTTTGFIDMLTPQGIYHIAHSRASSHSPMLRLMPVREHVDPPNQWRAEERRWMGVSWGEGVVVKCGRPVTLYYNVERGHWMPVADSVQPFQCQTINHEAARAVSRQYRLAAFEKIARAYVVMRPTNPHAADTMHAIATALREGRVLDACKGLPVGAVTKAYGRLYGGRGQIDPGFFQKLRDWVYDHEGVIEYETLQMLTPQQYETYLKMSKRFA
jgi:hypothetical protein